jgi:hypothetical protein
VGAFTVATKPMLAARRVAARVDQTFLMPGHRR